MKYRLSCVVALLAITACTAPKTVARVDSLETRLTQQVALSNQLGAQKDSLVRVVLDADAFLGQMDSAISTVKGLPRPKRKASDPLANQLQARKEMQDRVKALVARAKSTASQLAALQRQDSAKTLELAEKTAKIEADAQMIADLSATIERQNAQIASLEAQLDSVGIKLFKAYYVVGTEKELRAKGIVLKEGGTNLLIARPGQTLVPSRVFDVAQFTPIDQRHDSTIVLPDPSKRYRVISRQSLDNADVALREGASFSGPLKITRPEQFWESSRFLILLKL